MYILPISICRTEKLSLNILVFLMFNLVSLPVFSGDSVWSTLAHEELVVELSKEIQVSSGRRGAYEPSISSDGRDYYVSWYDTRHGVSAIYVSKINGHNLSVTMERHVNAYDEESYEPSIISYGDYIYITYYTVLRSKKSSNNVKKNRSEIRLVVLSKELVEIERFSFSEHNEDCSTRAPTLFTNKTHLFLGFIKESCSLQNQNFVVLGSLLNNHNRPDLGDMKYISFKAETNGTWIVNGDAKNNRVAMVYDTGLDNEKRNVSLIMCSIQETLQCSEETFDGGESLSRSYPDILITDQGYTLVWLSKNINQIKTKVTSLNYLDLEKKYALSDVSEYSSTASGAYISGTNKFHVFAWQQFYENKPVIRYAVRSVDNKNEIENGNLSIPGAKVFVPNLSPKNSECIGIVWNDLRRSKTESYEHSDIYFKEVCAKTEAVMSS